MVKLLQILYLLTFGALVTSAPVKDVTQRDADYARNPLSDWDTPLPVRDDEAIEPVPQADLKH